jgi:hypothetical protein
MPICYAASLNPNPAGRAPRPEKPIRAPFVRGAPARAGGAQKI